MAKQRNASALVSGMGMGISILTNLHAEAKRRGLSDEDFHRLATPEGESLIRVFVDAMVEDRRKLCQAKVGKYPVTVPCGELTLADMVKVGKYNYANPDITEERFPIGKETYEVELILVHLNRDATSDEVLAEMERQGLRPAKIEELLAFGEKYPDIQREFPIISLGSSALVGGNRYVPCLLGFSNARLLYLLCYDVEWLVYCRFLAVRK